MDLDPEACYRAILARDPRFDGRVFTGVVTTGIYCRPVCPARTPLFANVRFFASAAAAQEAGFRPCLRCRPETAPDLGAWRGTSNTVSRALALIELGALDDGDTVALADRLGVGDRQLRRLFRQHLGASPIAVAQTRRVLLAKQLLHETDLPMAEVALASGFGSIRRFNETFRQIFDRQPGALRRHAGETSAGKGEVVVDLRYRPPYDWPSLLAFLAARAIPGVESVTGDRYARTIDLDGASGTVRVAPGRGDALTATIRFPRLAALPTIIARLRRVLDLSADPALIAAHLAPDPVLGPLVSARPGLRVPGAWDGFELAVRAMLGQQITVAGARTLAGRLVEAHGVPLAGDVSGVDGLTHRFPTSATLAGAALGPIGLPRTRAASLSALAASVVADPHLFGPGRGLDAAIETLCRLPGIGDWTAHYIAMRAMREPDAFPAGDLGLRTALAGPDGTRPGAAQILKRAEPWRPWRAYAAQHLWASLTAPSA